MKHVHFTPIFIFPQEWQQQHFSVIFCNFFWTCSGITILLSWRKHHITFIYNNKVFLWLYTFFAHWYWYPVGILGKANTRYIQDLLWHVCAMKTKTLIYISLVAWSSSFWLLLLLYVDTSWYIYHIYRIFCMFKVHDGNEVIIIW